MSSGETRKTPARWKYIEEPLPDWVQGTIQEKFSRIYRRRFWEETGSISGPGSTLEQTGNLIAQLPRIFSSRGIASLLDLPCGDFNWMREIDLSGIEYWGADIVEELVAQNQARYGSEHVRFLSIDVTSQPLPKVDLILCRDCLVHFSYADFGRALNNLIDSGSRYLLATTFPALAENRDIETGDWRPLNLEKPPIEFPPPLELLVEGCPEEGYEDKSLGLWELPALKVSLACR